MLQHTLHIQEHGIKGLAIIFAVIGIVVLIVDAKINFSKSSRNEE